ncbi:MAG: ArsR family transcriptional regulator [Erysipelotrichales bacterium]|nr:MAG: ArsR family transcriptional regulator [Erysipelotrichales bacterium]
MLSEKVKIQLLVKVSKLYYMENKNQSEIAAILGVSRSLVSKYLSDAKELGIVEINIHDLLQEDINPLEYIVDRFHLQGGKIVPFSTNEDLMNQWLVDQATQTVIQHLEGREHVFGLGWGSTIGDVVSNMARSNLNRNLIGKIVPIIGNAPTSNRNYHTNELVRMLSEKTMLKPTYLYSPVICSSEQERDAFISAESFQEVEQVWDQLDTILVNIRNHPSVPDLATVARFKNRLHDENAVGMLLGYYFDIHGKIIHSDCDYAIQISLPQIKKAKRVIAMASSRVRAEAIIGALNTGYITHILINRKAAEEIMKKK